MRILKSITLAGAVLLTLAACNPSSTPVTSDGAVTWAVPADPPDPGYGERVSNPTSPAPYRCWRLFDGSRLDDAYGIPDDCAAHFEGRGFAVAVPDACRTALEDSWYNTEPPGTTSGPTVGPLVLVVRSGDGADVLLTTTDSWAFTKQWSRPVGQAQQHLQARNLYVATAGAGTITSGYRNSPYVNGTEVRVETVPRVAPAPSYKISLTCGVDDGAGGFVRKTFSSTVTMPA